MEQAPQSGLKEISDDVFDYLRQRHFDERGAGREFFFMLNDNRRQVAETRIPFLIEDENLVLSFWNGLNSVTGQYNLSLVIAPTRNVFEWSMEFLVRDDAGLNYNAVQKLTVALPAVEKLKRRYDDVAQGEVLLQRTLGSFYIINGSGSDPCLKKLTNFIEERKPVIDDWVKQYGTGNQEPESFTPSEYYKSSTFYAAPIRPSHFDEMLTNVEQALKPVAQPRPMPPAQQKQQEQQQQFALPEENQLPVQLTCLEVRNYKGIKHIRVDQIPPDTRWIFLTGENGFGKSSVLQALTLGLWGSTDDRPLLSDTDNPVISVDVVQQKSVRRFSFSRNTTLTQPGEPLPMAAYGAGRLLSTATVPPERSSRRRGGVSSLFFSDALLFNVESELIKSYAYNKAYFDLLARTFCQLIPDLADVRINTTTPDPFVEYYEKDRDNKAYTPVKLSDLAAGFRNLLSFVGDMVMRLTANQGKVENWQEMSGIVIIDELELYLHPKYQRMLPGKLSELFPKVQFIASTHSPIPLLGAPKETLVLTVDRNEEMGVMVNRTEVNISKLMPNAILTSPIFGFEDIMPESADSKAEVETADHYDDALLMQKIKEEYGILTPSAPTA